VFYFKFFFFTYFLFVQKRAKPNIKNYRNKTDILKHPSLKNIIKNKLFKLTRRSLKNNQIKMIHKNVKVSKSYTYIFFTPNMDNLQMPINFHQLPDMMKRNRNILIKLEIVKNHADQYLRLTFNYKMI